jgi:signal transduction histidine kinase
MAALPDDLPQEAVAEAECCRQTGIRSNLSIPLRIGGHLIGAIAFAAFHSTRQWPEDLITRLKIVGEVFAQALARSRAEHETRGLRAQLWHSDRVARVGALTGSIAHELNQPLMAILNNAQAGLRFLSGSDPDIEEIREILQDIARDDKRAGAVIRGLRTMVRRQEPERLRIQLVATIEEVLELLYSEFLVHQVEVKKHFETACAVLADKTQIQQVMLNLVMNAIEAMRQLPGNQRRLRLTVSRGDSQVVRVAVRDCGVGISEEKLAHAFDAFWSTKDKGMGLGLAVSRSIVEAHGGSIWAEANDDQGVTFYFELPLVC